MHFNNPTTGKSFLIQQIKKGLLYFSIHFQMKNTQSESLHYLGPQQGEEHPASVMQNRYFES